MHLKFVFLVDWMVDKKNRSAKTLGNIRCSRDTASARPLVSMRLSGAFLSLHTIKHINKSGSSQLTGDEHLLNTVEYSIPTTVCQDAQSVILEISKSIRSSRHHLHFSVEALGDAV